MWECVWTSDQVPGQDPCVSRFIISVLMACRCVCCWAVCVWRLSAGWAVSSWGRGDCEVGVSMWSRSRLWLVHFLTGEQRWRFTALQHSEHMSLFAHSAHTPNATLTFTAIILLTYTLPTGYLSPLCTHQCYDTMLHEISCHSLYALCWV